jgi:2-dehydro-3-deoxyphosphooctonate aldolase (KDO 8-P synthase)
MVFKTSYAKANRLSHRSYAGPGLKKGLAVLRKVKGRFGVPVLTDVHSVDEVGPVAEVAEVIQIPAFLSRQTALVQAAAKTKRVINLKKGQFLAPEDMKYLAEKCVAVGNRSVLLTERGTSFGYHDLVVDLRSLVTLRGLGYPVIYDATHSLQKPSGAGGASGGAREFLFPLTRAAVACGLDGLFVEVHPSPERALSDPATQLPLNYLKRLLEEVRAVREAVNPFVPRGRNG